MPKSKTGQFPWFTRTGVIFLLVLQGCANNPRQAAPPVPVEDRTVEVQVDARHQASVESRKYSAGRGNEPGQNPRPASAAVLAMLSEAEQYSKSGDNGSASATIERALRIEPKNARLWHRLGQLKLREKNYQQAINIARKSNSLAAGDRELQVENWGLIVQAYEAAGEKSAAKKARLMMLQLKEAR